MSISSEILRLQSAKSAIASAIISKGGSIASGALLDAFPAAIEALPSGGDDSFDKYVEGTLSIASGSMSKIRAHAFYSCTSLTTASFPNVTEIGDYAFQNCKLFTSLYLAGSSVAYLLNTTGFTGTPIASGTGRIYVPASLVTAYQSATNWAVYSSQITSIPE